MLQWRARLDADCLLHGGISAHLEVLLLCFLVDVEPLRDCCDLTPPLTLILCYSPPVVIHAGHSFSNLSQPGHSTLTSDLQLIAYQMVHILVASLVDDSHPCVRCDPRGEGVYGSAWWRLSEGGLSF